MPKALAELTDTRNQLVCVIDEYGGFAGVITLEDIAEELLGQITVEDGSWIVTGGVHLDEIKRAIGHDLLSVDECRGEEDVEKR